MGEDEPPGAFSIADCPRIARGSGECVHTCAHDMAPCKPPPHQANRENGKYLENEKASVHRCARISVLLDRRNIMTNVRIVFYVTAAEKAALARISKQTGAPASELMRRAFKQWLKGQKG